MDLLNVSLIGWLFSIGSGLALAFGIWLIVGIHLRDEAARKELAARALDDLLLFGIWILGLAGGIGVLLDKSWSRWRVAPPPRVMLSLSLAMFILPVVAICVATIVTLRGENAARVLSG